MSGVEALMDIRKVPNVANEIKMELNLLGLQIDKRREAIKDYNQRVIMYNQKIKEYIKQSNEIDQTTQLKILNSSSSSSSSSSTSSESCEDVLDLNKCLGEKSDSTFLS